MSEIVYRSKLHQPCPCCQSETKGCSVTADELALCRGKAGAEWRLLRTTENAFGCYRRLSSSSTENHEWKIAAQSYSAVLTETLCSSLARHLSLPLDALKALPLIGYRSMFGGSFTFPECDARGQIIGLSTRTLKGDKKAVKGSKRGLTLIPGWEKRSGPVCLVEGVSDTLALTHAGFSCIGRPSNTGGKSLLKELLKGVASDREIILVGENDQKPGGLWPGMDGVKEVGGYLIKQLPNPIFWVLPPEEYKDCRAFLTAKSHGSLSWKERAKLLIESFLESKTQLTQDSINGSENIGGDGGDRGDVSDRSEIFIDTNEHEVNDQAANALVSFGTVYQRGGILLQVYRPLEFLNTQSPRRPKTNMIVRELNTSILREHLTKCCAWLKQKGDEVVPAHPPGWSINAILSRGKWPNVPLLEAVVNHPVILENGTILSQNGYDASSGLLVDLPANLQISIPPSPTQTDAALAAEYLLDFVIDFDFASPSHRSAWLAGLLTPLAWFAFEGPAPLFLIDANIRAAGKGLLADSLGISLTGARFPVTSYTNDKEELRKKITSLAVSGDRVVLLDNLVGMVGNDVLDAVLTSSHWKDRLLGSNRIYDGPIHVCWYGTGNNVQLDRDTPRRVLPIRLETLEEKPELRKHFKYPDLRKHIATHRSNILQAALTILRAWFVAGKPSHDLEAWGSFEGWSNTIREAIVFAGLSDPGLARSSLVVATDRHAVCMSTILQSLEQYDCIDDGVTAAEVIKLVQDPASLGPWHRDLKAAVTDLCKKVDASTLGYRFREFHKRNFSGRMLVKTDPLQGYSRWTIQKIEKNQTARKHHHDLHHLHEESYPLAQRQVNREVIEL